MDLESRIEELEVRQAFQDDAVQSLSDVLAEQQRVIERLQAQVMALIRRQEELSLQVGGDVGDVETPPPHY